MQEYTFPSISYEQVNDNNHYVIDVRSPSEFAEFHLPGSINIPLFSDVERKLVGTIYKQKSIEKAKKVGVDVYARKLPEFYEQWMQLQQDHPGMIPVVTCARGGMRSGSFVSMMLAMKLPVLRLDGGIRSVRQNVQKKLDEFAGMDWKTIVLGGHTGTGKTKWLLQLKERGYPVIDLEGLASHRGSVFGHIGLPQTSQKQFEFDLVRELEKYAEQKTMIIEAESQRIGRIVLPPFILEQKEQGSVVHIEDKLERRVNHIMEDYRPFQFSDEIAEGVDKIKKRLPTDVKQRVEETLENQQYEELFGLLLQHYYDPRYNHKNQDYDQSEEQKTIRLNDFDEDEITSVIQKKMDTFIGQDV
ncbi:tRNA 2-selenouridine(34) synthase MnmH [Salipaludibacillus daqingensis]|uniref:tRNA 2-selenouridine(34) synthase MnmH n=1 Tax=Salipaludibacillus daqingensis TaxID=3041001 RepID=UPI0024758AAF|nr:tRNA 2-selenouridine(34) synthase MnmH [Salipaludibacillus daqingensis]